MRKLVLFTVLMLFPILAIPQPITTPFTVLWTYDTSIHDGFKVYRKIGQQGLYNLPPTVVGPAVRQVVIDVEAGNVHCFVATAFIGAEESPRSNEACKAALFAPVIVEIR